MKRINKLLGVLMIAAILLAQTGCAMIAGQLAVAGGKKVYEKMKDDKVEHEQTGQQ